MKRRLSDSQTTVFRENGGQPVTIRRKADALDLILDITELGQDLASSDQQVEPLLSGSSIMRDNLLSSATFI